MERREFLKAMGGGLFLAATGSLWAEGASSSGKPNIVLCMADDQGWGDMGYYGHPELKTPHFDEMAAASIRFDRFYAAAPVCSPTRGSVMTGRNPNRFGCFRWGYSLRPQEVTVAEALKGARYTTGHFGKWHLGSVRKGSPVNPGASGFDEWLSAENYFDNNPILSREGTAVPFKGESSMVTADAAIEFIRKHAKDPNPFLAVVWFGSPHGPHKAAGEYLKMYSDVEGKKRHWYGEITGMDAAFGKLRKELRTLGIHRNTILWYCSDNGGLKGLSRTGGREHKGTVYEGGLRVPGLLEWPARIAKPFVTDVPCNTSDIYPTLVEIAGAKVQNQPPLDGVSLMPLIAGTMKKRPEPMGFWYPPAKGKSTPSAKMMSQLLKAQKAGTEDKLKKSDLRLDAGEIKRKLPEGSFAGHAAWLDWPYKLHRFGGKGSPRFELYDLSKDPDEKADLAPRNAERVKSMNTGLEKWLLSVVRSHNGADYR